MSEAESPEATPVEEIENVAPAPESTAEQEQEPQAEVNEPEAKPGRTFTQDELDKIVQKRLAKESRRVARMAELEAENRLLKERRDPKAPEQPQGKPTLDKFDDYDAYMEALTDWKVDQRMSEAAKETEAERQKREAEEVAKSVREKVFAGADKYDDFEEVISDPNLQISHVMAEAMAEIANGSDVAYYLGSNPAEALRISKLRPAAQVVEIIKLEAKVSAPPKPTKAPPPIVPSGQKATATKDPSQMTDKEFAEWRRRQIAQRR